MNDIDNTLKEFDYFHDWHIDSIALRGTNPDCPDTVVLSLRLQARRAIVTFHGMTRLSVDGGDSVNIVLSMERVHPDTEMWRLAQEQMARCLKDKRTAENVVLSYPTAGFAIAVEFDSMSVETMGAG